MIIVTTGRATKLIDSLQAGVKEYVATLKLGATTPSFDLETEIDATYPTDHITRDMIDRGHSPLHRTDRAGATRIFRLQGRRQARLRPRPKGREVELKPKVLVIDEIEVTAFDPEAMTLTLRIVCSKGTYIRALARDIGEALGSGAHLTALRRTRVGDATLGSALSVDDAVELIRNCSLAPQPD